MYVFITTFEDSNGQEILFQLDGCSLHESVAIGAMSNRAIRFINTNGYRITTHQKTLIIAESNDGQRVKFRVARTRNLDATTLRIVATGQISGRNPKK